MLRLVAPLGVAVALFTFGVLAPEPASAIYELQVTASTVPDTAASEASWPGANLVCNPIYVDTKNSKLYFKLNDGDCDQAWTWAWFSTTNPQNYYVAVRGVFDATMCGAGCPRFNVIRRLKSDSPSVPTPVVEGVFKVNLADAGLPPSNTASWTTPWGTGARVYTGTINNVRLGGGAGSIVYFNRDADDKCGVGTLYAHDIVSSSAVPWLFVTPYDCGAGTYSIYITDSSSGTGTIPGPGTPEGGTGGSSTGTQPEFPHPWPDGYIPHFELFPLYEWRVTAAAAPSSGISAQWPGPLDRVCNPVIVDTSSGIVHFQRYNMLTQSPSAAWYSAEFDASSQCCAVAGNVEPCRGSPGRYAFSIVKRGRETLSGQSEQAKLSGVYAIDVGASWVTRTPSSSPLLHWGLYARADGSGSQAIRFTTGRGATAFINAKPGSECGWGKTWFKQVSSTATLQLVVDPRDCGDGAFSMLVESGPMSQLLAPWLELS